MCMDGYGRTKTKMYLDMCKMCKDIEKKEQKLFLFQNNIKFPLF